MNNEIPQTGEDLLTSLGFDKPREKGVDLDFNKPEEPKVAESQTYEKQLQGRFATALELLQEPDFADLVRGHIRADKGLDSRTLNTFNLLLAEAATFTSKEKFDVSKPDHDILHGRASSGRQWDFECIATPRAGAYDNHFSLMRLGGGGLECHITEGEDDIVHVEVQIHGESGKFARADAKVNEKISFDIDAPEKTPQNDVLPVETP